MGLGVDSTGWHPVMGASAPLCFFCRERPGTENFDSPPGGDLYACRRCWVGVMLNSAREQAARIPELEKELAELTKAER